MAWRFNAGADRALRTANQPATNADWTIMFWLYLVSDLNAFSCFMYAGSNNYGSVDWTYIGTDSNGTTILLDIDSVSDNGTNLSTTTWYHCTITRNNSGSQTLFYLDAVLDATVNTTNSGNARWEFGAVGTGNNDRTNGRIDCIKRWDGIIMSAADIALERETVQPITNLSNFAGFWPTFPGSQRLNDEGPNSWDFTEGGTLTDEAPPPIPWGLASYSPISPPAAAPPAATIMNQLQGPSVGADLFDGTLS